MSFLGDIVSSIGGEKAPAPPIKPPSRPSSTKPQTPLVSTAAHSIPATKPVYKGTAGTLVANHSNGVKRKADEALLDEPNKSSRPISRAGVTNTGSGKPSNEPSVASTRFTSNSASITNQDASKTPVKQAPKGSYAAMLAKAKEAQHQKAPSQVGMIKHQATEKIKPSKVAERLREEQEKSKMDKTKSQPRPVSSGKPDAKRRSASPSKKAEQSKMAKGPRPPLHAPTPQYKGTIGTAPKKSREDREKKQSRYDEYLGTDEEDEGEYGDYGGEDNYWSEESSDMEGGFDELEAEESKATREARQDDARELALEQRLKKEKLERKQKLEAMASKPTALEVF